jgi:hypothetical protein
MGGKRGVPSAAGSARALMDRLIGVHLRRSSPIAATGASTTSVEPVSKTVQSVGVTLVVLVATLALSACSSSQPPRALTQADIPSYLGVRASPTARSAGVLQPVARFHGCKTVGLAVFTASVRNELQGNPTVSKAPGIISVAVSCPSVADAEKAFRTLVTGTGGRSVSGLGDEARLFNVSKRGSDRLYMVGWRQNNHIGAVDVGGPPHDTRITPELAELLARRAVARS